MEIIKTGDNFDPENYEKEVICERCNSKLKINNEDMKFGIYFEPYYNYGIYEWCEFKKYGANVLCPICKKNIKVNKKGVK